jgi:outer membrane protein OmpA-like peptidoglycan-associated protein
MGISRGSCKVPIARRLSDGFLRWQLRGAGASTSIRGNFRNGFWLPRPLTLTAVAHHIVVGIGRQVSLAMSSPLLGHEGYDDETTMACKWMALHPWHGGAPFTRSHRMPGDSRMGSETISPLVERVSNVEGRLGQSAAKLQLVTERADMALERLDNLRMEKQFVLNLKDGAHFAFGSATITPETRRQIDRFVDDIKDTDDTLLVVVGHTDNRGPEDYNFELGQKRATIVARYLISRKGMDPLCVMAVSYGANAPIADNTTQGGRRKNRRVEILVYKESITSSPERQPLNLERTG